MAMYQQDAQSLIDKIKSLPAERIEEVEDFVDFLRTRVEHRKIATKSIKPLEFPVISVSAWPADLSLRREDMYNDDGR